MAERTSTTRLVLYTALGATLAAAGVAALLVTIVERQQEARNPVLPGGGAGRRPSRIRRCGGRTSPCSTTATAAPWTRRGPGTAAARPSPHADGRRPAVDRGAVAARGRPAAEDDVGGLRLLGGLPRGARPRLHARRPDVHRAAAGRAAARHVHALPRVGVRALQEAGRRRPDQGLRADEPDAVRRGAQAGDAPGGVHRLPRAGHDGSCASRGPGSWRASARSRPRRGSPTTT